MPWLVLIVSGMLEAVWATTLSASRGFARPLPTAPFAVSLTARMLGLAWAMTSIPTGTAYAVWVGIGATLSVVWSMAKGDEVASPARLALIVLLVGAVFEAVWPRPGSLRRGSASRCRPSLSSSRWL